MLDVPSTMCIVTIPWHLIVLEEYIYIYISEIMQLKLFVLMFMLLLSRVYMYAIVYTSEFSKIESMAKNIKLLFYA